MHSQSLAIVDSLLRELAVELPHEYDCIIDLLRKVYKPDSEPRHLGSEGHALYGAFVLAACTIYLEFGSPREACEEICNKLVALLLDSKDPLMIGIRKNIGGYRKPFADVVAMSNDDGNCNRADIRIKYRCALMNPLEVLAVHFLDLHNAPTRLTLEVPHHNLFAVMTLTASIQVSVSSILMHLKKAGFGPTTFVYAPKM